MLLLRHWCLHFFWVRLHLLFYPSSKLFSLFQGLFSSTKGFFSLPSSKLSSSSQKRWNKTPSLPTLSDGRRTKNQACERGFGNSPISDVERTFVLFYDWSTLADSSPCRRHRRRRVIFPLLLPVCQGITLLPPAAEEKSQEAEEAEEEDGRRRRRRRRKEEAKWDSPSSSCSPIHQRARKTEEDWGGMELQRVKRRTEGEKRGTTSSFLSIRRSFLLHSSSHVTTGPFLIRRRGVRSSDPLLCACVQRKGLFNVAKRPLFCPKSALSSFFFWPDLENIGKACSTC